MMNLDHISVQLHELEKKLRLLKQNTLKHPTLGNDELIGDAQDTGNAPPTTTSTTTPIHLVKSVGKQPKQH